MPYYRGRFRLGGARGFRSPSVPLSPLSAAAPAAPGSGVLPLPPLPRSYVVFDFETTGFSPTDNEITEVGWLVVKDGLAGEPHSALCQIKGSIPHDVEVLTGITNAMVRQGGLDLYNALSLFYDDAGDLPLVGHNIVRFDVPFLEASCRRVGLVSPERRRYHDTAAIFKGARMSMPYQSTRAATHYDYGLMVLGVPSRLKYNLALACASYGLQADDVIAHRAAGDVLMTHRLYQAILAEEVPA
jgi:DNA polymerase III epsilon subunit-like protein